MLSNPEATTQRASSTRVDTNSPPVRPLVKLVKPYGLKTTTLEIMQNQITAVTIYYYHF